MNPATEGPDPLVRPAFLPGGAARPAGKPDVQEAGDDPRLVHAAQEYLAELEAGRRPVRAAFLARFPELGDELARYLDALDMIHAAAPRLQVPPPPAEEALPAEPLGDFRIVREIGRGGMGVVYEAVQLSLGRRVALKVLPFAAALDAKQLQRFKNEAQAAAQLHHTNIVPVHAVGFERGFHYYAMQLIEGQNLADLIAQLRPAREQQGSRGESQMVFSSLLPYSPALSATAAELSTQRAGRSGTFYRTAARLIAQAAEALEYAHQLGVIHRDVKPANLMLDGRGNLWVTDFGLAQFHTSACLTRTGDLMGTLRYMSPEQAGGERVVIDHRTDIYSLGATFYELLTLRPLFDGADHRRLLRQILHDEPRPPRALDRAIPPELETIVLKAVSKNPADRYRSAQEFADDLHRFLRHEPIRARRPTVAQRARKWLRRHPSVIVTGVLLLALLAAGSLVAAWLIRGEQEKTRLAYEREQRRARQAEERLQLALRAAKELIQIGDQELADQPFLEGVRKRLLEAALSYFEEFIEQRRDDPDAQAELRETREYVKKILGDLAVLQGVKRIDLLTTNAAVLDDLGASPKQREQVAALARRVGEQRKKMWEKFGRLTAEDKRRSLADAHANEAAVAAILTDVQQRRLEQIALQEKGPGAFRDMEVARALKLTAEQRERIRAIVEEWFFGRFGPRRGPGPGEAKAPEQTPKAVLERIQALLTEEQARQWKEMTGEPFKGQFFGPFGPPPR